MQEQLLTFLCLGPGAGEGGGEEEGGEVHHGGCRVQVGVGQVEEWRGWGGGPLYTDLLLTVWLAPVTSHQETPGAGLQTGRARHQTPDN